jgi:hypothetical protein
MVALLYIYIVLKSTICNPVSLHFSCTYIFTILFYFSVLSANGICNACYCIIFYTEYILQISSSFTWIDTPIIVVIVDTCSLN